MNLRRLVVAVALIITCLAGLSAQKVHVKGYVRKDGTVVQPYDRNKPGAGTSTTTPRTPATKATTPAPTTSVSGAASHKAVSPSTRSEAAKHEFMKQTGFPHGRSGYVIDHIVPLACGGADAPSNMQWQTVAEGKAKDHVERRGCSQNRQWR
jgi:hypothetical protein